jgi:hypothetical protein
MVLIRYALKPILQVLAIYISLCALSTFSAHAQNAIRIDDISGVSNRTIDSATNGAVIYAGIAGTCTSASTTQTCNSCTGGLAACNPSRTHPNLVLTIAFTVTGELTGKIRLQYTSNTTGVSNLTEVSNYTPSTTATITKNATASVSVNWNNLCSNLAGDPSCTTAASTANLYVCISADTSCEATERVEIPTRLFLPADTAPIDCPSNAPAANNGICGFTAFPGDEKITVTDLDLGANYPNNDTVPITNMIILFSETGFADIDNSSYGVSFAELSVDSDGSVSPDVVTGLTNETKYFFRSAMMDSAKNLYFITSDAEIAFTSGDNDGALCGAGTDDGCKYIATPSQVYGLLTEDFNCFITTAAYGSSFAPKVMDFRAFRNKFLVPSELGRKIIFFYYDVGPKAARWLGENTWAKPVVRAALLPAWVFVETANFLGLVAATILFTSIFILLICGLYILRSNKRRIEI